MFTIIASIASSVFTGFCLGVYFGVRLERNWRANDTINYNDELEL